MSIFLIIFLIICFVGGLLSRSNGRILINDENRHKIKAPENSELSKSEFKTLIINKSADKRYAYDNSENIVKLCRQFFNYYSWDVAILEVIIISLSTDRKFEEAYTYAGILCSQNLNFKLGYFYKAELCWYRGEIYEGSRFFSLSVSHDMDEKYVNQRKKELMPYLKPKDERDRKKLEEEKRSLY